jgi:hypothetical protein
MKIIKLLIGLLLVGSFCDGLKAQQKLQVVCIGNSITQGKVEVDSITQLSYRFWLWEKLDSAGYQVDFVGSNHFWFRENHLKPAKTPQSRYTGHIFDRDHEGFYGIKSGEFLDSFTHDSMKFISFKERMKPYKPDVAFIHMGSNDKQSDSAQSVKNLETIVFVLYQLNPGVKVFIAKLNTPWQRFINHSIDSIVSTMKKNCRGIQIVAVDQASGYINNPQVSGGMTVDWAHPNTIGQKYMADKWFKAFMSADDQTPPIGRTNIKVENVTDSSAAISWNAATDNKWIAGYEVWLNGKPVNWRYSESATHDKQCLALVPNTSYKIYGLKPNTVCKIQIKAFDYANNSTMVGKCVFKTKGIR